VKLAEARRQARESGEFMEADRLRDEIAEAGWEVRDVPGGFELVPRPRIFRPGAGGSAADASSP
jgi:cysteinyl-tRNA synthetase